MVPFSPLFPEGFGAVLPTALCERWKSGPGLRESGVWGVWGVWGKFSPLQTLVLTVKDKPLLRLKDGHCSRLSSDSQFEQWFWRTMKCLVLLSLSPMKWFPHWFLQGISGKSLVFLHLYQAKDIAMLQLLLSKSVFTPVSGHNGGTALEQVH